MHGLTTRWRALMRLWLLSCMCFVTGCGTKVLESSDMPLSPVYTADGKRIEGYRAYSDGMMSRLLKECHAAMDQKGK
ncbi:MAG: hypothetical protein HY348_01760 [Nitrospira defluvii]|nr:hypothetical protein [Nitrospira defluvii]